jgi:hypothetical protein
VTDITKLLNFPDGVIPASGLTLKFGVSSDIPISLLVADD